VPPSTRIEVPPAAQGDFDRVTSDVGDLWFPRSESVMRPFLARHGTWEPEEGQLLRRLIRPNCRFLDVGANVGYFSLLAARAAVGVSIVAVEPLPSNIALLRVNLWCNRVEAEVLPLALTNGDRLVTLSTSVENPGDTRATAAGNLDSSDLLVPGIAGDELFENQIFDVIKIDVQGFEPDVLSGMTATIARSAGVVIVSEFWPAALVERHVDPMSVLDRYRRMGLSISVQVAEQLSVMSDAQIVDTCMNAGPYGQVNLILRHAG
jgi:FkbM family methyltransferase